MPMFTKNIVRKEAIAKQDSIWLSFK